MKRSIASEYDTLADKLCNYSGLFGFQLKNLCIKAEPVALVDIEVPIEGKFKKLEEFTAIAKKDDYTFVIVPHFEDDMPALMRSLFKAHPEWKLKIDKMTVTAKDVKGNPKTQDVPLVEATMPEVDDDRYDLLKESVKLLYEDCKAKMEAAMTKSDIKFAELLIDESEESRKDLEETIDLLKSEWTKKREKLRDDKLKEIEDAYRKWLDKVGV